MQTFFQDNNSDELIILFDGWGMDEKPYSVMKNSRDVLFVNNYKTLDFTPQIDLAKYRKKYLIAFSAGVFISAYLQNKLPDFDKKIAINGTLTMLDTKKGIPAETLQEMENITLDNALGFRKKLFSDENHLNLFNKNQPSRDLKSSMDELFALEKHFANTTQKDFFDEVIIAKDDKIIPCENQAEAWAEHKNTRLIEGGHFPFYNFKNLDEIIGKD